MTRSTRSLHMTLTLLAAAAALAATGLSSAQTPAQPDLPPPQRGLLPSMRIAEPAA